MKHVTTLSAALAAVTLAAPLAAQGRFDWQPGDDRLVGPGVPVLLPELRDHPRGRAVVMRNFDRNNDGRINPREADVANAAFVRVAGPRRDRSDWNAPGCTVVVEETVVAPAR